MWIFLDLIILAVIVFYIIISAKRGFLRTVIEFVGFGISIYLAFLLGGVIAEPIYDNTVKPTITKSISDAIGVSAETNIEQTVDEAWNSLPSFVIKVADSMNISSENISDSVTDEALKTNAAQIVAEETERKIACPIVVALIQTVVAIPIFLVLMVLVKIFARIIGKVFNFSIMGKVNHILGGVLGFGKGVIVSALFAIIITTIVSLTDDGFFIFTMGNIDDSLIFGLLAGFSPIL